MTHRQFPSLIVLAALAAAGAARAQTAGPAPMSIAPWHAVASAPVQASRLAIDISDSPAVLPFAQANALKAAGLAQTAVDHRFASTSDKGLVGSVGFLCGLQPGQSDKGAAAAYGYDPQGRFLGARLHFAF